jgi:CDGSH-type Zn-finger protein/uncharacterized Fe-S cluster protein YjdI
VILSEKIRGYDGKDITIKFGARRCIHSAECVKRLPGVFEKGRRPWIDADARSADEIAEVVGRCPTGALHFERKDGGASEAIPGENTVRFEADGPVYAHGAIEIVDGDGALLFTDTRVALCRCGVSENKPFCDGRHSDAGFRASGEFPEDRPADQEIEPGGKLTVTRRPNGPLMLTGPVTIRSDDGTDQITRMKVSICRCGQSGRKPFCDGSHKEIGFVAE